MTICDFDEQWREVVDLFFQVKALVAYEELYNKNQSLCLPAVLELRSALDHLMRVNHVNISSGQGNPLESITENDPRPSIPKTQEDKERYCRSHFGKAKGHLYRAAYDALDSLIMTALKNYNELTEGFDFDDICEAWPDYPWKSARIDEARRMVVACKMSKDVDPEKPQQPEDADEATDETTLEIIDKMVKANGKVVEKYIEAFRLIEDVSSRIKQEALPIRAAAWRRKRLVYNNFVTGLLVTAAIAGILTFCVWIAQWLPSPKAENPAHNPPPITHNVGPTDSK